MNRRPKTCDAAPAAGTAASVAPGVRLSPGPTTTTTGSSDGGAESGVDESGDDGGRGPRAPQKRRRRPSHRRRRPAVEDIIDGFAICSFETVRDLTLFVEKKTMIQSNFESSSSDSEFDPLYSSSTKSSSNATSLSSPSKLERKKVKSKHCQSSKLAGSRVDFIESSDRSLSPASLSSVTKSSNKAKVRTAVMRSDNLSTCSGVSFSPTSSKNRKQMEESTEKGSPEPAAFSGSAFHEESERCNIVNNRCVSAFDELENEQSKLDRLSVAAALLTDAESESSVVLVKEELKESSWVMSQNESWSGHFAMEDVKRPDLVNEKRRCSNLIDSKFKKSLDAEQTSVLSSDELGYKWTVIKEKPSLLKTEKNYSSSTLTNKHRLSPSLESHSRSFERQRMALDKDSRLNRDYDFSVASKTKVIDVDSPTRSDSHRKSHPDNLTRVRSSSNDLRTMKLKSRDGSDGFVVKNSFASTTPLSLTSAEIKNERASPISVRGSSSHQSSSRSSTSNKKSSNSHSLGNDFSSLPPIDRNLHSPLAGHSSYHASGRPHQPAAFSIGGLPMAGLFGSPLPQFPVSGLHPSGGLLGSSMGLHPSLLAAAPLMAGMNPVSANPVATNPDLFQVQQELNARFLQDHRLLPMAFPPVPLTLRTETHQHQHLHHHQHLVPTPYMPAHPAAFSVASHPLSMLQTMGPGGIDLLSHSQTLSDLAERDRISKLRASLNIFDGSLPPSYASLIPGMPPPPAGLTSNMHGAFTINESKSSSLSASHLLRSLKIDQQVAQSAIPSASTAKKTGRWCAAHVEIAFRIYYHRQRSLSQDHVAHGRPVAPTGGTNSSSLTGGIHRIQSLVNPDVTGNGVGSFHRPHLQFGINSFLRPTPQSFHPVDVNSYSTPFISRPQHSYMPGSVPKVDDSRDLKSSSSTLRSTGAMDGSLRTSSEQDHKRRLSNRDVDELLEKKRKLDLHTSADHRINATRGERNSPHLQLSERSSLHRNELSRNQRLPESRSPLFPSPSRPFRQNLDSKKRELLAVPLSIDPHANARHSLGGVAGTGLRQSTVSQLNLGPGIIPTDGDVTLPMDRDRLDPLRRDRERQTGQSFRGQPFATDADRFRSLLPSHPPYGLSLNGLSKPEHDSFKPYADLSLQLDAKPTADVFKPNPEGLFIVSSSSARHFSNNGIASVSSIPPPLVRLPLNDGLSSFKHHMPYGPLGNGLSDFSSSLCGLPGGDGGALQLPFR